MFPKTIIFSKNISIRYESDSLNGSLLQKPFRIQYGKCFLNVEPGLYGSVLLIPRIMRLALFVFCKQDQQILYVADSLVRGSLKFTDSVGIEERIPIQEEDAAEIVGDLLQADGVPLWIRNIIQKQLLKEFKRKWYKKIRNENEQSEPISD